MSTATDSQPRPHETASQTAESASPQAQPDSPPATDSQSEKKKPVYSWSHPTASGRIDIAVWDKVVSTDRGDKVLYHVTCQRSYRRQEDGGYENTGVFWPTDLLVLAHGLRLAFDRIKEMQNGEPF